eukprot:TRINITY_DN19357_c0_g1_i1.p2 TRINITY_DN19357_c0_g1~~TRINITY_DN19357_c0_g1_i1.p2  ORF type:complete len:111 (-),score=2.11 TRINITY_DN19357_c0_g1_i1:103-435(-)
MKKRSVSEGKPTSHQSLHRFPCSASPIPDITDPTQPATPKRPGEARPGQSSPSIRRPGAGKEAKGKGKQPIKVRWALPYQAPQMCCHPSDPLGIRPLSLAIYIRWPGAKG